MDSVTQTISGDSSPRSVGRWPMTSSAASHCNRFDCARGGPRRPHDTHTKWTARSPAESNIRAKRAWAAAHRLVRPTGAFDPGLPDDSLQSRHSRWRKRPVKGVAIT